MARAAQSIDEIIRAVVSQAMQEVAPAIQRHVAALAAEELENSLAVTGADKPSRKQARRPARKAEITKWVTDRNARRVPKFVIELTGGLDTKKKIVAKYGENAVFELGKPLPKTAKAA